MERQLVTERVIRELVPIEGADKIELAKLDGWQCVVKKGQFSAGEKALYAEIDSIFPSDDERFAFLEPRKYRVKSMKLRGALSQGLLTPVSALTNEERMRIFDGESPTDVLRVTKFEPPVPMGGSQKGTFPTHLVPKTDQERIQNVPDVLKDKLNSMFEITEKLDGTSCTIWYQNKEGVITPQDGAQTNLERNPYVGVASRNWEMDREEGGVYSRVLHDTGLVDKLAKLGRNIAIQGEIIGPGIQKNQYKLEKPTLYVFDIYDIDAQKSLAPKERRELTKELDLNHAPVVYWSGLSQGEHMSLTLENVLAEAEGKSVLNDSQREGIVFKSLDGSLSFKAISNKWLLKNE